MSGKQARGKRPAAERLLDVQSGMLRRGGQGNQDVTGYTASHFLGKYKNITHGAGLINHVGFRFGNAMPSQVNSAECSITTRSGRHLS